ncbi:MAG: hypothetical protein ACRDWD_01575, partial [Acidimicrobiia bacterium]
MRFTLGADGAWRDVVDTGDPVAGLEPAGGKRRTLPHGWRRRVIADHSRRPPGARATRLVVA